MVVPTLHPRTVTLARHSNDTLCVVGYVEGIGGWEKCDVGGPGGSNAIVFHRNKYYLPRCVLLSGRKAASEDVFASAS